MESHRWNDDEQEPSCVAALPLRVRTTAFLIYGLAPCGPRRLKHTSYIARRLYYMSLASFCPMLIREVGFY